MALNKQNLNLNFSQGLDTKTDPFQVQPGKFLSLSNSVFDKAGRLTKRNGFGLLTALPDATSEFISTFNGNLTAIGTDINAYSSSVDKWIDKGSIQSAKINTLPLVRTNLNQTQADAVVASNGLVCTVYTDEDPSGTVYKYAISDSTTSQNIIAPVTIAAADSTYGTPKVFILGNYFLVVFTALITAAYHLQYIAIAITDPTMATAVTDLTANYIPTTTLAWDGYVANNTFYLAWNGADVGGAIRVRSMSSTLFQTPEIAFASEVATHVSVTADEAVSPIIYVSYYDSASMNGSTIVFDSNLATVSGPTSIITGEIVDNIATAANDGICTIFYEVDNDYSYGTPEPTHYIKKMTIDQAGSTTAAAVLVRSVGLASKAKYLDDHTYFLSVYYSIYQPTYFLLNEDGRIMAKLAYSNAGPYLEMGLPNLTINETNNTIQVSYLFKDTIESINRTQGSVVSAAVYSQLSVNLATFTVTSQFLSTSEIGNNLFISGGFLWGYDGLYPVENGFFLWPDNVLATSSATGGSMTAQDYFYQVIYEWSDSQGNIFQSAPSIPAGVTLSGDTSVDLDIPTLRLTYKTDNPVKIVIYRWSAAQQTYYQVTSITQPTLNDPTVDSITYNDGLADSSIIGNEILYTTGGVLENISPPATDIITLFNNRLWMVDSEDRNLLWFSKQVIESTPVEMSDLLTMYIAPSTASEGSTGPITAMAPMDDKLVIFKENALGYITGVGPDNTGANSGYSDFVLINSVVGCTNQQSIVITPRGLMFQSNKGIWLVSRELGTQYIGAPVEDFNSYTVLSAINIPQTNQVRFTMSNGITLMYDYYFDQWGTFTNIPAISSTIYTNLHTYVDSFGRVFQETPGTYLDNSSPVLMKFTTSWINLAGVQGLERFYQLYLLGTYKSPFKLNMGLAYNYNDSPTQSTLIDPSNTNKYSTWGSEALWGSGPFWGSTEKVFEARLFPQTQKCESFQISMQEIYDASQGIAAGEGLTLSGVNLVVGLKKGYRTSTAAKSFG